MSKENKKKLAESMYNPVRGLTPSLFVSAGDAPHLFMSIKNPLIPD